MEKYEVKAFIEGVVIIEVENEDEAIEKAACLDYDEFNWGEFHLKELKKV